MVVIGLVLLAVAVAAAIVLIAQNQDAMVTVHGLGYTGTIHLYWVLVAGLAIAVVGIAGVAMMSSGAAHSSSRRRQRRELARENARLSRLAEHPVTTSPDVVTPAQAAPMTPAAPVASADARTGAPVAYPSTDYTVPAEYAQPDAPAGGRSRFFHRTRHV
jgi:hypothetical protein